MTATTDESMTPPECVFTKFPDHTETIKDFYATSPTFREICSDYEELVIWIENYCPSEKQPSAKCDYALDVLKDLEAEIIECLDRNNKLVNDESMRSKGK